MIKRLTLPFAVLALAWANPSAGFAQSQGPGIAIDGGTDGSVTVLSDHLNRDVWTELTIPPTLSINVDVNSVAFAVPDAEAFEAGYIDGTNSVLVSHFGNVAHDILVQTGQIHFTDEIGIATEKPISHFLWKAVVDDSEAVDWTALATSTTPLQSSIPAGDYTDRTQMDFRVQLSTEDVPDVYRAQLTVSIIAS